MTTEVFSDFALKRLFLRYLWAGGEVWLFMLRCIMQLIVPLNVTQGPEKLIYLYAHTHASYHGLKCEVTCYLTGREDELVTGQVRLIAENVGLFHFQLVCDLQKPQ